MRFNENTGCYDFRLFGTLMFIIMQDWEFLQIVGVELPKTRNVHEVVPEAQRVAQHICDVLNRDTSETFRPVIGRPGLEKRGAPHMPVDDYAERLYDA